jgi:hypothetical protein
MSISEASDDPFERYLHREALPNAGIRIVLFSDSPPARAEEVHRSLLELVSASGRPVETATVPGPGTELGPALAHALEDATLPLVLVTGAREPWTNAHLEPLLQAIDFCDHVIGRRPASFWNTWTNHLAALPRRLLFALPLLDVHSPCQLHRLEKLREIRFQSVSSFLDIEILAKGTFLGHLIDEVEVPALVGWTKFAGWWSDFYRVLRHPQFDSSSRPTEEAQRQREGDDGPSHQDDHRAAHIQEPCTLQDHTAQRGD